LFEKDSPEGGIVILKIKKEDNIDKMWESILFAMIGKLFAPLTVQICLTSCLTDFSVFRQKESNLRSLM